MVPKNAPPVGAKEVTLIVNSPCFEVENPQQGLVP
jgi:hypothetical protein